MTHVHVCPTEIAVFMMMYDYISAYAYHYYHIISSVYSNINDDECKVCNND